MKAWNGALLGMVMFIPTLGLAQSPPAFTASTTSSLASDINSDGVANPGDRIEYETTIQNTGSVFGQNVQVTITLDENTTLVPGSLNVSPLGIGDSYAAIGNTQRSVTAANGVLANDTDADGDALTAVGASTVTQLGGTVTVATDGSFSYLPPVGISNATDSFNYTLSDGRGGTDSGTVMITLSERVWYVDNSVGVSGDGRSSSPFNNFSSLLGTNDVDGDGDIIFIATGSGTYSANLVAEANQKIIGQGIALVLNSLTLTSAGTPPTLTAAAGDTLTLAAGVTARGLRFAGGGNRAIAGANLSGSIVLGNLELQDLSIFISGGTPTISISDVSIIDTGTDAIGLVDVQGAVTISNTTISDLAEGAGVFFELTSPLAASLTVNGSTFQATNGTLGPAIGFRGTDSGSNFTFSASGNTISGPGVAGSAVLVQSSGAVTANIQGNTFQNGGGTAIELTSDMAASALFNASVVNNQISGFESSGIEVKNMGSGASSANLIVEIRDNTLTNNTTMPSAGTGGIVVSTISPGATCLNLRGNTVSGHSANEVSLDNFSGQAVFQIAGGMAGTSGSLTEADTRNQNSILVSGSVSIGGSWLRRPDGDCSLF